MEIGLQQVEQLPVVGRVGIAAAEQQRRQGRLPVQGEFPVGASQCSWLFICFCPVCHAVVAEQSPYDAFEACRGVVQLAMPGNEEPFCPVGMGFIMLRAELQPESGAAVATDKEFQPCDAICR